MNRLNQQQQQRYVSPNIGTNIVSTYTKPMTKVWFNQRGGKIYKTIYDEKTKSYTTNVVDYNQVIKQ